MFAATKDQSLDEKVKEVKMSTQKLKNDAREGARDIRDTAEELGSEIRHAAQRTGQTVNELWHSAGDEVSQVTDTVAAHIRNKPVQSSLVALAAGFVIGALFRR